MQGKWLLIGGASLSLILASGTNAGGYQSDSRLSTELSAQLMACGLVDLRDFGNLSEKPFSSSNSATRWNKLSVDIKISQIRRNSTYLNAYCERTLIESLLVLSSYNTSLVEQRCDFLFDKNANRKYTTFMREFGEGHDGGNAFSSVLSRQFSHSSSEDRYCQGRSRSYYELACQYNENGRAMSDLGSGRYRDAKNFVSEYCGSVKPKIFASRESAFDRARSHNARQLALRNHPMDAYGNAHCHRHYQNGPVIITKKESGWSNLLNFTLGMTRVIAPLHYQTKVANMNKDLLHHGMSLAAKNGAVPWLVGGGNIYGGGFGGGGACGYPPYHTAYTGCAYGPGGGGAHYPYGQYPFRGGQPGAAYGGGFHRGVPGGVPGAGGQFGWRTPGIYPGGPGGGAMCGGRPCTGLQYPGGGFGYCGGRPCVPGAYGAVMGGGVGRYPGGIPGAGGRFGPNAYPYGHRGGSYYPGHGGGVYPGVPGAGGRFGPNAYPFGAGGMSHVNSMQFEMQRLRQEQMLAQRRAQQIAAAQQRAQALQNQARGYQNQLSNLSRQRAQLDAQARQSIAGLNNAYRGYQGVLSSIRGPAGNAGAYGVPGAGGRFAPGGAYQGGRVAPGGQRFCRVNCYPGTGGAYYNPPYVSPIGGYNRGNHSGIGFQLNVGNI